MTKRFFKFPPDAAIMRALNRETPTVDPHNPDQWWRMFPNRKTGRHAMPIGALVSNPSEIIPTQQAIEIGLAHFALLTEVDLPQPTISHYYDKSRHTLYTLSRHVDGVDAEEVRGKHPRHPHLRELGTKLLKYANRVEQTHQTYMLWDAQEVRQWRFGNLRGDRAQRAYLLDTDIFLDRTNDWIDEFRDIVKDTYHLG